MKATSITLPSSHLPMLSHPKEVAELIERAATKGATAKGAMTKGAMTKGAMTKGAMTKGATK